MIPLRREKGEFSRETVTENYVTAGGEQLQGAETRRSIILVTKLIVNMKLNQSLKVAVIIKNS